MRRLTTILILAIFVATGAAVFAQSKAPKARGRVKAGIGKMAIEGKPTSVVHCTQGEAYVTHALGSAPEGTRFVINAQGSGEEDLMATALVLQMGAAAPDGTARLSYQYNDDADELTLDPRLEFTLEHTASVTLQIGTFDGTPGCYVMQVEINLP